MSFMLLIVENPEDRSVRSEAEGRVLYERMLQYSADLQQRELLETAQALKTTASGVRITKQDGSLTVRDGPFTEAREMIGGFFLLKCTTLAEAVDIARTCPAAEWATVEVREIGACFQ